MFTISSVSSTIKKVIMAYAFKIDLQNSFFHIPIHPVPSLCIQEHRLSVLSNSLRSEYSPPPPAHCCGLPPQSGDIGTTISQPLVNPSSRLTSLLYLLQIKCKKSQLELLQDMQFLGFRLRLNLGRVLLPDSKSHQVVSSQSVLSYQQVSQLMGSLNWASGLTPLGCLHPRKLQSL